jgi:hypothetical protein
MTCFVLYFVDALTASKPTGSKRLPIDVNYLASSLPNVLANPIMVETSGQDPTAKQGTCDQDDYKLKMPSHLWRRALLDPIRARSRSIATSTKK